MTQAIYYIDINDTNQLKTIPEQAISLSLAEVINKATLLSALANAAGFPDYCHKNWDSAFDCLTDSNVEHLIIDLTNINRINTEDFNVFKNMIEDAYADFGKPQLWVTTTSIGS